jgi:hypothetical protein
MRRSRKHLELKELGRLIEAAVVADAIEAGISRHGAFKAIAEAGALGIAARQAAQQRRVIRGHKRDGAGEAWAHEAGLQIR